MEGQEPTRPGSREELDRLQEELLARREPRMELQSKLAARRVMLVGATTALIALALWLLYAA
jgi:hypothetical protein